MLRVSPRINLDAHPALVPLFDTASLQPSLASRWDHLHLLHVLFYKGIAFLERHWIWQWCSNRFWSSRRQWIAFTHFFKSIERPTPRRVSCHFQFNSIVRDQSALIKTYPVFHCVQSGILCQHICGFLGTWVHHYSVGGATLCRLAPTTICNFVTHLQIILL